ncbi:cobalamin-dependent protein [Fulvimarina sp. MAC3]|uniref:cobalamin B12-binding domain-containing protein n=1 Tax=Fulvimarina sp. MAC3 TaxID=3148887 RepID=UPI0031FC2D4A
MAYLANGAQFSQPDREEHEQSDVSAHIDTSEAGVKAEQDCSRQSLHFAGLRAENHDRNGSSGSLEDAVRQAVIPRLYAQRLGKRAEAPDRAPAGDRTRAIVAHGAVNQLLRLVLSGQPSAQEAFLNDLHEKAVPIRALIEDVVVPVANEIGAAWADDRMSFAEVTLKIGLMQTAVSNFTAKTLAANLRHNAPRFLVAPTPGEQHVFGAAVLSSLLVAEGYQAEALLDATSRALCDQVRTHDYAAVGLSCNSDRTLPSLKGLIAEIRNASRNRSIRIMIGGWALHEGDESLSTFGADLVVTNSHSAIDAIVGRFEPEN